MTHTKRATYFTDTDMRKCRTCGIEAHTADGLYHFVKDPRQKETSRRNQCKKCHNKRKDRSPKVKINTKDTDLKYRTVRNYNCTVEEYHERMATSDVCEVCGAKKGNTKWTKLCYDHDHTTMEFRGVLCNRCNISIGALGDTIESVQKALDYLKRDENGR